MTTLTEGEFETFLIGKELGRGYSRVVYELPHAPDLVLKHEQEGGSFCNILEWELWTESRFYDPIAQWLCPCHSISRSGQFLLMHKTKPLHHSQLPKTVPQFFTDLKLANWGEYKGRPVCHDYGSVKKVLRTQTKKAKFYIGDGEYTGD